MVGEVNRCEETRLFIKTLISAQGEGCVWWKGRGSVAGRIMGYHKHSCVCALVTWTPCCWESLPQTAARDAVHIIKLLR